MDWIPNGQPHLQTHSPSVKLPGCFDKHVNKPPFDICDSLISNYTPDAGREERMWPQLGQTCLTAAIMTHIIWVGSWDIYL